MPSTFNGLSVQKSAPIETPILVLIAASLALGSRAMILVARSISDPVREVVVAMTEVEHGQGGVLVEVYEPSEIGRLQVGFNRMVADLEEREHCGIFSGATWAPTWRARHFNEMVLSGDVRDVAVLFVDLVGSTAIAAACPPEEVARY